MATTFDYGLIFDMDVNSLDTPNLGDNKIYTLAELDLAQLEPLTTIIPIVHPVKARFGTLKPLVGRSN
jgi:hypothetical protein